MSTLLQKVSEYRLDAGENSSHIPDDLIFEILLRLPVKCIARCRCVSKHWSSIIDRQDFRDHYMKRSSARPKHLFALQEKSGKVFFFSAPQNQEDDNSSTITASYHMSLPDAGVKDIYSPINGLVCVRDECIIKGMETPVTAWVICNPSTGQSFFLPRMHTTHMNSGVGSFFGYDPIEKQFKILSMTFSRGRRYWAPRHIAKEHQVLTLKAGKLSWRMIKCGVPHLPNSDSVCINGVLYYKAMLNGSSLGGDMRIMCFDVRSEKYSCIKVVEPFTGAVLVNYSGKLASIRPSHGCYGFSRETTSFVMWVLDDLEKKEWSKHIYKLPPNPKWRDVTGAATLHCVGVTDTNEVVLAKESLDAPFYVFYFSLERETMRRVEIQGMEAFRTHSVYTFVDHVEDVKLLKGWLLQ